MNIKDTIALIYFVIAKKEAKTLRDTTQRRLCLFTIKVYSFYSNLSTSKRKFWKNNMDSCTFSDFTVKLDCATMTGCSMLYNRQTQTGTTRFFGVAFIPSFEN